MNDFTLRLWHAIECPHSMRVRLVLDEKHLGYESHVVSLDDVGDEVRRLNPNEEVPVLVQGDCVVYEAAVIAEYLEEQYPDPRLFPADPPGRARARLLMQWADAKLVDPIKQLEDSRAAGRLAREPTDPQLADALHAVHGCMRTIARQLEARPYILGQMSIVDLYLAPFVVDLDALGVRRDEIPSGTATWIDRLRDHPSIAQETLHREEALGLHETGT